MPRTATRFLTDAELAQLEADPQFLSADGTCPTCKGTGTYRYRDDVHECPNDGLMCDQQRLFRIYCLGKIPLQYQTLDWADFPEGEAKKSIDSYLESFMDMWDMGIGVEVFGKSMGVGKTWTTIHVMKEVAKLGYSTHFTTFSDIKNMINLPHAEWNLAARPLLSVEVLNIDEILRPVSDAQSAFYEEKLEWVVRQRSNANLVTLTSTNMTREEMEEHYPRVYSVLSLKQIRIELSGDDFRRKAEGFDTLAELAFKGERRPIT